MGTVPHDPTIPERRSVSIPLPRPLWIGLAAILLVVAAVGIRISVQIYRQKEAIRTITEAGGSVYGDYPRPPLLSKWFAESGLIGLANVQTVTFFGADTTGEALRSIGQLDSLEEVVITVSEVTDTGLAHLRNLHALRLLFIYNSRTTDAGGPQFRRSGYP